MSKVTVMAGPCGLTTTITATKSGRNDVKLNIDSQCSAYNKLNEILPSVNAYEEIFGKMGQTNVDMAVARTSKHAACPVACAILKAVELEAGLALPKPPVFTMEK